MSQAKSIQDVVASHRQALRAACVSILDSIPAEKSSAVLSTLNVSDTSQDVTLLVEEPTSGSAAQHFLLITAEYLAFQTGGHKAEVISWNDVKSVQYKRGIFESHLNINGKQLRFPNIDGNLLSSISVVLTECLEIVRNRPLEARDLAFEESESSSTSNQLRSVASTLDSIKLSRLIALFESHNLTMDQFANLDDSDLVAIGVTALGDRKTILGWIAEMHRKSAAIADTDAKEGLARDGRRAIVGFDILSVIAGILVFIALSVHGVSYSAFGWSVVAVFATTIYFIPSRIAFLRRGEHRWIILLANSFFGMTVVIWFILLFLSLSLIDGRTAAFATSIAVVSRRS